MANGILRECKMTEKNYIIRQEDLLKKVRRAVHRPTRMEKNPKAYTRKEKYRKFYSESEND